MGGGKRAEEEHPAQGDEVHLGEVDDPHGVVNDAEPDGHHGVDGPAGQAREHELDEVLERAHRRLDPPFLFLEGNGIDI
jgi:hypothetical protein